MNEYDGMNEKNAIFTMTIKTRGGTRANVKGRISAKQWGELNAVLNNEYTKLTPELMTESKDYKNLMNEGICFIRKVSEFLNIRVDFSRPGFSIVYLETVKSGFLQNLTISTLSELKALESLFLPMHK